MGRAAKAANAAHDERENMDSEKRKDLLHQLEMQHQRGSGQSDLLVKDEDVRRLKLRILMLRDENTSLRDQISQNEDANAMLAGQCSDLSSQVEAKIEVVRLQEKQLRKQEREFSNVKAELDAMNNLTQNSTNVLAEKLSLARELAVLKPELEHLRSQLVHHQETLAEKLSLERQVSTLELELANEKKATQRAMKKRESNDRVEDELRVRLREVEKQVSAEKSQRERLEDQLAQEKRTHQLALQDQDSTRDTESDLRKKLHEAQRLAREERDDKERVEEELQAERRMAKKAQKQASPPADDELQARLQDIETKLTSQCEAAEKSRQKAQDALAEEESRNDALEKKLEKMRTKLRETQEQLKQCQADLRKAQKPSVSEEVAKKTAGRQGPKKRGAPETIADEFAQITIATPSADDRPRRTTKKRAVEPSMLGEKSTFSITPFLNRGKEQTDEAAKSDDEDEHEDTFADMGAGSRETAHAVEVKTTTVPTAAGDDDVSSAPSSEHGEEGGEESKQAEPQEQAKKARGRPKKVLGDAPSAKKNNALKASKASSKKGPKHGNVLEQVTEEVEPASSQDHGKTEAVGPVPQDDEAARTKATKGEETRKKRKVLGSTKTLFDEEDGEAPPPAKAGKKAAENKITAGVKRSAFGGKTFSPLKRERRGVGASFLS